jgi:hypothetical protein
VKTRLVVLLAAALALTLTMFVPTGAKAVGVGKQCGGFPGIHCDAGLYCQQKPGQCRIIDIGGKCAKPPLFCPHITSRRIKVCGCNNVTYNNDCERQQAMVSLLHKGACK